MYPLWDTSCKSSTETFGNTGYYSLQGFCWDSVLHRGFPVSRPITSNTCHIKHYFVITLSRTVTYLFCLTRWVLNRALTRLSTVAGSTVSLTAAGLWPTILYPNPQWSLVTSQQDGTIWPMLFPIEFVSFFFSCILIEIMTLFPRFFLVRVSFWRYSR